LTLLKLNHSPNIYHVVLPTIFTFSLAQTVFSYMIIQNEVSKFNFAMVMGYDQLFPLWSLISFVFSVIFASFALGIAIILWAIGIFFCLFTIVELWYSKKTLLIVLLATGAFITMLTYPIVYPTMYKSYAFYTIGAMFYLITVFGVLGLCLPKAIKSHTIEK